MTSADGETILSNGAFFRRHRCAAYCNTDVTEDDEGSPNVPINIRDAVHFIAASNRLPDRLAKAEAVFNEQSELPRHVAFPASTIGGTNPFARLPEEQWFDRLYD